MTSVNYPLKTTTYHLFDESLRGRTWRPCGFPTPARSGVHFRHVAPTMFLKRPPNRTRTGKPSATASSTAQTPSAALPRKPTRKRTNESATIRSPRGGVWSIARGLARNVDTYKQHRANCDLPRRNDLHGKGSLSEEALAGFTRFFLQTCLDQARFMENLC